MRLLLFIILSFPFLLYGQEQVSDFDQYGVFEPTDFSRQLGFAEINGEQYLLQENDSLIIYKWSGEQFEKRHVVPQFHQQALSRPNNTLPDVEANRSLLNIKNGNYYRFLDNGVQIIDIETGRIEAEYNGADEGWTSVIPGGLYEDQVHFTVNKSSEYLSLVLDGGMGLDSFPRSYFTNILIGDTYFGFNGAGRLYVTNLLTARDSLVADFGFGFQGAAVSEVDKTLIVIDELGDVWKIGRDLSVVKTLCNISSYTGLDDHMVDGSKLIAVYEDSVGSFRIVVYDLNTGNEEQQFIIEPGITNNYYFQLVESETPDDRFSIFGISKWIDSSGGPELGASYIIDHKNNRYKKLPEVTRVRSYSPFVIGENIYLETYTAEFNRTTSASLARYNLTQQEYVELDVNDGEALTVAFGFPIDGSIVVATNTKAETSQVWSLSPQDSFTPIQTLDYLDNLGVLNIKDVVPMGERFYFSNNSGVYSALDNTRKEIGILNEELNQYFTRYTWLSGYNDKVTYVSHDVDHAVFSVYDTNTGVLEKFTEVGPRNDLYSVRGSGPFYFFVNGSSSNAQYFDAKTNSFGEIPNLLGINPVLMTAGSSKVLIRDMSSLLGQANLFIIDYDTNEVEDLQLEIYASALEIRAGDNDAFYFYDRNSDQSIRLRVLDEDGSLTDIFNGKGSYRGNELHAYDGNGGVTFFNFRDTLGDAIIVANDLEQTDIVHIENSESTKILKSARDILVLEGDDSERENRYFVYRAFNPVQEVVIPEDAYVTFVDVRDSTTLFLYMLGGDGFLVEHNHFSNTSVTTQVSDFSPACRDGIRIDDETYLLDMARSFAIDVVLEPWILNLETYTIERLTDVTSGPELTFPENFLPYKSWIYFTALLEGKGRQWFRLDTNLSSYTLELLSEALGLSPYPNPTSSSFQLDRNLERLYVYNTEGQMVKEVKSYFKNKIVDIQELPDGVFQVIGIDKEGQRYQSQLVKVVE